MKKLRFLALLLVICLLTAPGALAALKSGDLFVDPLSGASFTVPEGWREYNLELTEVDTYLSLDVDETANMLFFFTSDLRIQLEAEGMDVPRAMVNNEDFLPPEDAAEFMEVGVADLEMRTYGGVEFYTCESVGYENGEQVYMFNSVCCHNGYLICVDFMGNDPDYKPAVFELLDSFLP